MAGAYKPVKIEIKPERKQSKKEVISFLKALNFKGVAEGGGPP